MECQNGTTMEIDEASAMDTTDEGPPVSGLDAWKGEDISDMTPDHGMTCPPMVSEESGLACGETHRWRLPEGVCEKRVVRSGEGLRGPVLGAVCNVTVEVVQSPGELHQAQVGYPLCESGVQIGEGGTPLSCLIDCAVMAMKAGEVAEVRVSGIKNLEGEFVFRITLHSFMEKLPPWRLAPGEKFATAAIHKERGAGLFKEGNIYGAFMQFRMAIRLLLALLPYSFDEDEMAAKSQELLCQCYLNLAACQMKSGHHSHVVTNCTQALNIDPSNVKAWYRRASANVSLGNYSQAQEDLEEGLRLEPHNRALLDLIHTVNAKLAPSESRMAQGLSKMFS